MDVLAPTESSTHTWRFRAEPSSCQTPPDGRDRPLALFLIAAFLEIAGCFACWAWLRLCRSPWLAVPGAVSLVLFAWTLTEEIREIPDGYAFRLPKAAEWVRQAADFVTKERLCCPFFGFTLQLEPEQGALWLCLTGREGVKPFISWPRSDRRCPRGAGRGRRRHSGAARCG